MAKQFVFVYGTLKGDEPNVAIEDRKRFEDAKLYGYRMEGHDGFPGVKRAGTKDVVIGELIEYDEEEILFRLDRIEGYNPNSKNNTFYDRRTVYVRTQDGQVIKAHVYIYMGEGMNIGEECDKIEVVEKDGCKYYNWAGATACW
jgi:gamma-glutamylcyclotransferase (GGCT)/AIG2-like uncharacterized protein YtfP